MRPVDWSILDFASWVIPGPSVWERFSERFLEESGCGTVIFWGFLYDIILPRVVIRNVHVWQTGESDTRLRAVIPGK